MPLSLADVLSAQAGGGPVYEGGPDANVTPGGVLAALGLGGPSWLDAARKQNEADIAAYQRGGVPEMMANTQGTQDLAGGFGGGAIAGPIKAYHGSPYDFAKFDISKIGTGEGAQAYGHGLYFAENPAVAESYRPTAPDWTMPDPIANAVDTLQSKIAPSGTSSWANTIEQYLANRKRPGKMYEVNINAEPGQFLNWDAPIGQQSSAVQQTLLPSAQRKLGLDPHVASIFNNDPLNVDAATAYRSLATVAQRSPDWAPQSQFGQHMASAQLNEAGIPGIRYLDQGSRKSNFTDVSPEQLQARANVLRDDIASGRGDAARLQDKLSSIETELAFQNRPRTSNYVVFNPEIVDILKKYGLAGLTMGGVLTAAGQEPAPSQ